MNPESDFKTTFNELLVNRAISVAKLSELSGVPERYIEALRIGNFDHLPPAPYVRGYLNKVAIIFGANPGELWRKYKNEGEPKISGGEDRLPANRFSLKKLSKGKILIVAASLAVIIYAGLRFGDILGMPKLTIDSPASATVITSVDNFEVRGSIKPGDKLTINGELESTGTDGKFQKNIRLYPGINTVDFRVKHFLGREVQDVRQIIYSPDNQPTSQAVSTSTPNNSSSTPSNQ